MSQLRPCIYGSTFLNLMRSPWLAGPVALAASWKGEIRMALHLHIQPVYSQLHPDSKWTIGDVRLLKHQVETLEAFRDPDVDVIFNTAMTGDGKSLAAYLPAFQDQWHVIAMYPTNELIRDQHLALPNYE